MILFWEVDRKQHWYTFMCRIGLCYRALHCYKAVAFRKSGIGLSVKAIQLPAISSCGFSYYGDNDSSG